MKQIIISKEALKEIACDKIVPIGDSSRLDAILNRYGDIGQSGLRVVVFAVVIYRDAYVLAAEKHGETVLGFGKAVTVHKDYEAQSFKMHIYDAMYEELDKHIPNVAYRVTPMGFLIGGGREYDKDSFGCLFEATLKSPIEETAAGGKVMMLRSIDSLGELEGWSGIILKHLKVRKGG